MAVMRQLYSVFNKTPIFCLYKYQNLYPLKGVFPNVHTLTFIQCTQIAPLLQSSVFPNVHTIHYLSAPSKEFIPNALRFKWVFPSLVHPFYSGMMEAGIGRIDEQLINTYIDSMIPSENGLMDISLHIPEYGIIDGDRYEYYMRYFFTKNIQCSPFDDYYQRSLRKRFMETIL